MKFVKYLSAGSITKTIPEAIRAICESRQFICTENTTDYRIRFKLLGYNIYAESKTSDGRIDAIVETDKHIYLFEFKLNKDDSALVQIKEKEYFKPYLLSQKKITLVGTNFDTETGKFSDWKSEEVQ